MKKLFKKGFTLVELLVVIAIIAILGTVSVVGYIGFTQDAKVSDDFTELVEYKTVVEAKLFDGSETVVIDDKDCLGDHTKYEAYPVNTALADGTVYYKKDSNDTYVENKAASTSTVEGDLATTTKYETVEGDYKIVPDKACAEYTFSYSTSTSAKSISVSEKTWDGDGFDDEVPSVTPANALDALKAIIKNSTGDAAEGTWSVILESGKLTSVKYHNHASEDSVEWVIADSVVNKL